MKRTLLLESVRGETRLAVIEDQRLQELYIDRPGADDGAGSIYLGRVENVLPGMNAAFVDIGMAKNAYLYAGDIPVSDRELARKLDGLRIERLARPGQDVLVQVTKAQSGQKGHRVSCHIALPGRLLVLLPGVRHIGISKKIVQPSERERLQGVMGDLTPASGMGVIARTAAAGESAGRLAEEWRNLTALWADLQTRARHAKAPKRMFSSADLVSRCARDLLNADVDAVWADGVELYGALKDAVAASAPEYLDRLRLHEGQTPLFDLYRVDAQLERALHKYVWLKSGGSLVIEETEAMTVIDVNTGKFTGRKDLEETLFQLNCEAAEEIARQMRLRDLGGIIIVDFIDMTAPEDNARLLDKLRELVRADSGRASVVGMTGLGLVELTRKKSRRSLSRQLLHTCSCCGGDGAVASHETTARRIVREIWRRRRMGEDHPMLVTACEPVVRWVKTIGRPEGGAVYLSVDPAAGPGEYAVSPADEARLPEGHIKLK